MFDPDEFLQQTVTAAGSTSVILVPEAEYISNIDGSTEVRTWFQQFEIKKEGSARLGEKLTKINVPFHIDDTALAAKIGRDRVIVRKEILLDLDENGKFDMSPGKNVALNQLRAALGQNTPAPWTVMQLPGAGPVRIKVRHRANPNNPDAPFAEVTTVTSVTGRK